MNCCWCQVKLPLVNKISLWVKNNPQEFWLLLAILLLGAFLRLFKIDQYLTFLGDEGRDVIVVRRLLLYADPILIGPGTSIGSMYLGPLYYYFIAPALLIANFSPIGPAVLVALLGVATIFLVWYVSHEWFYENKSGGVGYAALIAAFLYAISPTVIIYSRSSWNPNIMPFFALLSIYALWRVWQFKQFFWLIVLGVAMAFVLQSHYLGLLLLPTLGLFWLMAYFQAKKELRIRNFIKQSVIGLVLFSFLMSPLLIFDARHGWNNFAAIKRFFTVRQETVSIKPWKAIPKIPLIAERLSERLLAGANQKTGDIALVVLIGLKIYILLSFKKIPQREKNAYWLMLSWLGFALLGLGLYKQEIYDHYFGFVFAVPYLLLAGVVKNLLSRPSKTWQIFIYVPLGVLVFVNLVHNPLLSAPNQQLKRAKDVAGKIKEESGGKPLNLAVIAERNYEDGYQYFLEKDGIKVVEIDAQKLTETLTDQLFVVCEMPKDKCSPTSNAKAQVANFGWSRVENEWEVFGARLYKLVHTQ